MKNLFLLANPSRPNTTSSNVQTSPPSTIPNLYPKKPRNQPWRHSIPKRDPAFDAILDDSKQPRVITYRRVYPKEEDPEFQSCEKAKDEEKDKEEIKGREKQDDCKSADSLEEEERRKKAMLLHYRIQARSPWQEKAKDISSEDTESMLADIDQRLAALTHKLQPDADDCNGTPGLRRERNEIPTHNSTLTPSPLLFPSYHSPGTTLRPLNRRVSSAPAEIPLLERSSSSESGGSGYGHSGDLQGGRLAFDDDEEAEEDEEDEVAGYGGESEEEEEEDEEGREAEEGGGGGHGDERFMVWPREVRTAVGEYVNGGDGQSKKPMDYQSY